MGFQITTRAQNAAEAVVKQPNIVLIIDGLDTIFGISNIVKVIRIGDDDLFIDGSWVIGGFRSVEDQKSLVSLDGTTTSIRQQLDIDKGRGSSISSFEISLVDKNNAISEIISPGVVLDRILGKKARIRLGFADATAYPEDYITIFRGIIDDVNAEAGRIKLNIAHPDQKKRAQMFQSVETALSGAITNGQTTITLETTTNILSPITGPDMTIDPVFTGYVRIEDEIIKYTGVSGFDLTGCVRGQLGTIADAHADESDVKTFYRLGPENVIDLSLKMMLSGWNGPFAESVPIENFNILGDATFLQNSVFFLGVDLEEEHGLVAGDYITITGAANGANNVTLKMIEDVVPTDEGTYLEINGVTFVTEVDSAAVCDFRSQYDTLPTGLRMSGDEVDIAQHLLTQRRFLSNFSVDLYLKETIENGKEFIEQELYKPSGAYSLPRKSRASLGYFVAPIPGDETKTISIDNVTNPSKLKLRFSINKNFFNTIVYKFEDDVLEDKFLRGTITRSSTSLDAIPVGTRAMVIESKGMRAALLGINNSVIVSNRRLDRFKFGAEFLEGVEITFGDGFTAEIGDILLLDPEGLHIVNTMAGDRDKPAKLFEVNNIEKNIKTGKIRIDLLDTGFDGSNRYSLIGPSSRIRSAASSTSFSIEEFFPSSPFGVNEGKKWSRYRLPAVKVRSNDFTTHFDQTVVQTVVGNIITVLPALAFTPTPGDVMELAQYDYSEVTGEIKAKYCHMQNNPTFGDGTPQYKMIQGDIVADITSGRTKVNNIEVSQDAPVTESLFNKIGANINDYLDKDWRTEDFTSSGTFTVPNPADGAPTTFLVVRGAGAGGGGGGGGSGDVTGITNDAGGGAGGDGAPVHTIVIEVTPGATYTVTLGTAGSAGTGGSPGAPGTAGSTGGAGGTSTFGTIGYFPGGAAGNGGQTPGGGGGGGSASGAVFTGYNTYFPGGRGANYKNSGTPLGGSNSPYAVGGSPGTYNQTSVTGGNGGGGGASIGAGGAGGNTSGNGDVAGPTDGAAGTYGSGGGGGGGSGDGQAVAGGNGGAGGTGRISVYWYGNDN